VYDTDLPTLQSTGLRAQGTLAPAIRERGPWFHNLHLANGDQTAPDHPLGNFPAARWGAIAHVLPDDLSGWRILDIGCNAGYYSFALAARGAQVLGIEHDPHYLAQARWAADYMPAGDRVRFEQRDVYELVDCRETFDLVLFLGVFYHLRHPLLGLDIVAGLDHRLLLFQTLTSGFDAPSGREGLGIDQRDHLLESGWPSMAFIEGSFAGDPSNWWVPNRAGSEAMLRSAGYEIIDRPDNEVHLAERIRDRGADPSSFARAVRARSSLAD
jgi:tRNA (mo5U34)-methyltransferase